MVRLRYEPGLPGKTIDSDRIRFEICTAAFLYQQATLEYNKFRRLSRLAPGSFPLASFIALQASS